MRLVTVQSYITKNTVEASGAGSRKWGEMCLQSQTFSFGLVEVTGFQIPVKFYT